MRGQRQWYMIQNPHGLRAHNCTESFFKHIQVQWILHSSERLNVHQSWNMCHMVACMVPHEITFLCSVTHFVADSCDRSVVSMLIFFLYQKSCFKSPFRSSCNTTTAHTHRPTYVTRKLVFCFWMYQTGTFIQIQEVMWHQWLELFCFFFPFFSYNADRRTM